MRKSFARIAVAAMALTGAPWAATAIGGTTFAAATALAISDAAAGTALLPGWKHSCGRDPRCFERGEARRQARRNAQITRTQ
jgi:hypothetical protein